MSTGSILSILAYPQYGYHLVCHTGLSLVHCSYLSVGSLQLGVQVPRNSETDKRSEIFSSCFPDDLISDASHNTGSEGDVSYELV